MLERAQFQDKYKKISRFTFYAFNRTECVRNHLKLLSLYVTFQAFYLHLTELFSWLYHCFWPSQQCCHLEHRKKHMFITEIWVQLWLWTRFFCICKNLLNILKICFFMRKPYGLAKTRGRLKNLFAEWVSHFEHQNLNFFNNDVS